MAQRTDLVLIGLIWAAGLGAGAQYGKISIVFEQLAEVYPQAGAALGFLVSLVGFVGILLGVTAGLLVARIGYRRALLGALWSGAGLSLAQALLPPLPVMLGLRALEGASHLVIVVAAPTLIAQLAAPAHRGFALTLWSTFFGVSYAALVLLGLPLVGKLGLPGLFAAHALWMGGLALILASALSGLAPPGIFAPLSPGGMARDHLTIYRSPRIAAPAAGWLFYTLCFLTLLTLLPPYLPAATRALVLGAMPLVSIAASLTLGVVLLRYISAVAVVVAGFAGAVLCLVWLLAAPGLPAACLALAAALGLIQGASFAAVPQLNAGAAEQAQANGALAQMGNLGNTLGTPIFLAVLAAAGYPGMIVAAGFLLTLGGVVHLLLARQRRS